MIKKFLILLLLGISIFSILIWKRQIVAWGEEVFSEVRNHFNFKKRSLSAGLIKNKQVSVKDRLFEGTIDEIISLVNQARKDEGLKPLMKNDLLVKSAEMKANDMKDKEYFEHISPEGVPPWFFVEQAGYKYKTVGENLAEGFFSAQSVHQGWMNSPGHRANILSPDFREIGVAIVESQLNGRRNYLIIEHFGSQLKAEDLVPTIICEKKVKQFCRDAKEKKTEVKKTIKEQARAIKEAKKKGIDKKYLNKAENNLDKLKEIKKEIKKYLKKCEKYIEGCNQWK